MIDGRIHFPGNPWPEGHPIDEFAWTARQEGDRIRFDLHLRSADYYSERDVEDSEEDGPDWTAPIVWGNYHRCTLSSTFWGSGNGFDVCDASEYSPEWLDGRTFVIDPVDGEIENSEEHAFHLYLLGHDCVVNHRIVFRRTGKAGLFDIEWTGAIALTYVGRYTPEHRFEAVIRQVPFPQPSHATHAE